MSATLGLSNTVRPIATLLASCGCYMRVFIHKPSGLGLESRARQCSGQQHAGVIIIIIISVGTALTKGVFDSKHEGDAH